MKQYFIVDKETKHMVGNTVYGSAKIADMDIEKWKAVLKSMKFMLLTWLILPKTLLFMQWQMIIHVFISRGLDNDTYRNLICFLFDYFYLHVYFIVDKETKHMVGNQPDNG